MTEEDIYTYQCHKCSKEIPSSEGHYHFAAGMTGAKTLCNECEKEFHEFAATFFVL